MFRRHCTIKDSFGKNGPDDFGIFLDFTQNSRLEMKSVESFF